MTSKDSMEECVQPEPTKILDLPVLVDDEEEPVFGEKLGLGGDKVGLHGGDLQVVQVINFNQASPSCQHLRMLKPQYIT